jgi:hypothetical protein
MFVAKVWPHLNPPERRGVLANSALPPHFVQLQWKWLDEVAKALALGKQILPPWFVRRVWHTLTKDQRLLFFQSRGCNEFFEKLPIEELPMYLADDIEQVRKRALDRLCQEVTIYSRDTGVSTLF